MNPVRLLASRNILIATAVFSVALMAVIVFQTRTGSAETMPSADRIGTPPEPAGDVVPLETVLTAFQRSRATALRHYRHEPFSAHLETVTPVQKNGWAARLLLAGGRVTAYIADQQWKSLAEPVAAGQTRAFTCFDWQSGAGGTVTLYGCGLAERH
jgi:hypothetical protein